MNRFQNSFIISLVFIFVCVQDSISQMNLDSLNAPQRDNPLIDVDVRVIERDINPGQIDQGIVTVTNVGDELLIIETELVLVDRPDDASIERMNVLIVTEGVGNGGDHVMLEAAEAAGVDERNILEVDAREIREIDIFEWDVIVWSDDHENPFYQEYRWYRDRFEEWIEDGGVLIFNCYSAGTWPSGILPGGPRHTHHPLFGWELQNIRINDVDPEDPIIAGVLDDENDDLPNAIIGDECSRTFFHRGSLVQNQNLGNLQVFYAQANNEQFVTMFSYDFGDGYVCVSSVNISGFWYHNWNDDNAHFLARNEILWANWKLVRPWTTVAEHPRRIDPDTSVELTVEFNGAGLSSGEYFADLSIGSNDPNNEELVVAIALFVREAPDISAKWYHNFGYPRELNWNISNEDVFVGYEYETEFRIFNQGSEELVIDEIRIEGDGSEFLTVGIEGGLDPIPAFSEIELELILAPEEPGDFEVLLILFTNDPDEEEFDIPVVFSSVHAPSIAIEPDDIADEILGAGITEHEIALRNEGLGELRFTTDIDISEEPARDSQLRSIRNVSTIPGTNNRKTPVPFRDDSGDILHEFDLGSDLPGDLDEGALAIISHSLAWDTENEWMWIQHEVDTRMIAINPHNNFQVEEFWVSEILRSYDMAYFDDLIYLMMDNNTYLELFDRVGNNVGRLNLDLDGAPIGGIAVDPINELLIVLAHDVLSGSQPLYIFSTEGERIARIPNIERFYDLQISRSIEWVPTHDFGKLWIHTSEQLWQLDIDTDNWEIDGVTQHFHTVGRHYGDGFAHDGTNFWVTATENRTVQIIDDGINESWMTLEPIAGVVEAEDEMPMSLTFDGSSQLPGDYAAEIIITTNDPESPEVIFPISLNISPAPFISVSWSDDAGFGEDPSVLDWNMFLPDIFRGQSYDIPVKIQNLGHEILEISNITCENELFSIVPTEFELEYREFRDAIFTLDAAENGELESVVTIITNDPHHENYEIPVLGVVSSPPIIIVEPEAIGSELISGESDEILLTIINIGESELRWKSEFEFLNENGVREDTPQRSVRTIASTDHSRLGPRRDVPDGRILLYQSSVGFGWVVENVFSHIRDLDYDWINSIQEFGEIDLYDYDAVWVETGGQQNGFNMFWEANIGRFEEYVSEGYSLFLEQGKYLEPVRELEAPGGLEYVEDPQQGILDVGPEDNWLVEQMEWEEGQFFLEGVPFAHVVYPFEALDNIENSDGYQVIVVGNRNRSPIIVEYSFGHGNVIVSGTNCGQPWTRWDVDGAWGSCYEVLVEYLLMLGDGPPWVFQNPSEGIIEPGEDLEVVIGIDSDGLLSGAYNSVLHILSNDPENRDQIIEVTLEVTGVPIPEVVWEEEIGYPDEINYNLAYDPLFENGEYPVTVTIANIGTDDLHIFEIACENENFLTDWNPENQDMVPGNEEISINLFLDANEIGEFRGNFEFTFDDDIDPINVLVVGQTTGGPIMSIDTDEIAEDLLSNEVREHQIVIRNEGETALEWRSEAEILAQPNQDNPGRRVRKTHHPVDAEESVLDFSPYRDEAGDIIAEVRNPLNQEDCFRYFAYDENNDWMWIAYTGVDLAPSTFIAVDLNNDYEIVAQFAGPRDISDLCMYEDVLYTNVGSANNRCISRFDRDGNNVGDIQMNNWNSTGIGASNEHGIFFIMEDWPDVNNRPIHVYSIDEDGGLGAHLGDIEGYNENLLRGHNVINRGRNVLWVDDHDGGSLWIGTGGDGGNIAWQFNVDRETWRCELAQSFYTWEEGLGHELDNIGHDGTNLWSVSWSDGGQWRSQIRIIDDGLNENGWLYWEDISGVIDPNEDQGITITIDTWRLNSGDYSAELSFYSNDPVSLDGPDHTIEISFTVTQVPNILVVPGDTDQDPVDFEIAYFGYPVSRTISVHNIGTGQLRIDRVRTDENNPDFYVVEGDIEGMEIEEDSLEELNIWYNPDEDRGGVQEATLVFFTNDPNREEGYPVHCVASIGAFGAPVLEIEPTEIELDMEQGDVVEHIINASNSGVSDLIYDTRFDIISEPQMQGRDLNSRHVRSVSEVSPARFPQRDQPQGRGLLLQERCQFYDYDFEQYFENIEDLDWERYRSWDELEDVDLTEFDFMWIGNNDVNGFNNNAQIERIEDFVDGGGALYQSSGTYDFNNLPQYPGGLRGVGSFQLRQTLCPIQLNPDENYFINYMNENDPAGWAWEAGQELHGIHAGAPFAFGYFRTEDIEAIENSDWYEVMVMGNEVDEPLVLTYRYGSGYCFVNTALDGYHHHWAETTQWGRTGEAVIWYLDYLSAEIDTFSIEPASETIEPGEDLDLNLTVNSRGLIGGEYQIELHFMSNDPENPDQIVDIWLTTTGNPELSGNPIPEPLEGAEIIEFPEHTWVDQEYTCNVLLQNVGTQAVNIEEIDVSSPENWDFSFPNENMIVPAGDEVIASIIYHPSEIGEHQAEIRLQTDAINVENGIFWWEVQGSSVLRPQITVDLLDDENSVIVLMDLDNEPEERLMTLSNSEGEPRGNLTFDILGEEVMQEPLFDQRERQIRQVNSEFQGPLRDNAGDILEEVVTPCTQTNGLTSTDNMIWGCSYDQHRLFAMNRETREIERRIDIPRFTAAVAYDGNNLWTAQTGVTPLYWYDNEGNLLDEFNIGLRSITSMTSNRDGLIFIKANENNRISVYSVEDREVIRIVNQLPGFDNNEFINNIEYVPAHEDGQLWGVGTNLLIQARINDNWETEHIQTIEIEQGWGNRGICHDGENLWLGGVNNTWKIVEDGIMESLPGWLSFEPVSGEIEPGGSEEITLTINSDELENNNLYQVVLSIESNDPITPIVEVQVSLAVGVPQPRHFGADDPDTEEIDGWVLQDVAHTLEVTDVTLDDEPISMGWEIGVYAPGETLSGGSIWLGGERISMSAYADNPEIEQRTGFRPMERFVIRVWDGAANIEYNTNVEFDVGPEIWIPNRLSLININAFSTDDLLVSLDEGWNMISINVDPVMFYTNEDDQGPDVTAMFEELRIDNDEHRIRLLKDGVGRFWAPGWNFINIPYWDLTNGYQVKLSEATEIIFEGPTIPADSELNLNPNWNLIAYFPNYELDASAPDLYVLSPIIESVSIAKDVQGRFMLPEFRFSNMIPWRPGQGYQVKVDADEVISLIYPNEQEGLAASETERTMSEHWATPANTGSNMSALVNIVVGLNTGSQYQIAAFSPHNFIVGTGFISDNRCGLSIWGDDESTDHKEGLKEGETFFFRIWDADQNIESDLMVTQILEGDHLSYMPDKLIVVNLSLNHGIPAQYYLSENYPNPFNNVTRLSFGLPEASKVNISVFDLTGRLVQNVLDFRMDAGSHDFTWDAKEVPAGVYLIQMKVSSFSSGNTIFKNVRKVILVK